MTFKEFREWCNDRACDGCWGMNAATICIGVISEINDKPFWKRKKAWKKNRESSYTVHCRTN